MGLTLKTIAIPAILVALATTVTLSVVLTRSPEVDPEPRSYIKPEPIHITVSESDHYPNGLGKSPILGFSTKQHFRCQTDCEIFPDNCLNDINLLQVANSMASNGYINRKYVNYEYIIIDDCWSAENRTDDGNLVGDPNRFPDMPGFIKSLHNLGFKVGLTLDVTDQTCNGFPGSSGYEQQDVDLLNKWGVDYVNLDSCSLEFELEDIEKQVEKVSDLLLASSRDIFVHCVYPSYFEDTAHNTEIDYEFTKKHCNSWQNWIDSQDSFETVTDQINWFGKNQDYGFVIAKNISLS